MSRRPQSATRWQNRVEAPRYLTSSYVTGRHNPLAKLGYSRDGRPGTLQIVYGLVTDAEGRPVAVEVVPGNTGDPATVAATIDTPRGRFGLGSVVLVGDRGMLTSARIEALRTAGLDWISSLRGPAIRALVEAGSLQLGLFDERNLAEIRSPDYPDERPMRVATRCSPPSGRESARICSRRPRPSSRRSPRGSPPAACTGLAMREICGPIQRAHGERIWVDTLTALLSGINGLADAQATHAKGRARPMTAGGKRPARSA